MDANRHPSASSGQAPSAGSGHGLDERARRLYEAAKRELAAQYDPERNLVRQETDVGVYYTPRGTLTYARCLLLDGDEQERARAAGLIENVLAVQERQAGNIHEGNFPWMIDDGHVTDLNAVEFVLEQLCHIPLESEPALPASTRAAIRAAMHLGLAEIARLDVDVAYTNITLLDVHNSILGGQLVGWPGWIERGARKLERWAAYTLASGAPREYNSPTYLGVDLAALAAIAEHAADARTRLLARLMEERLWLHLAAHYHHPSAQIAGPHSRAYQDDVTGGRGRTKMILYRLLGDERLMQKTPFYAYRQNDGICDVALARFHCPEAVRAQLAAPLPFTARETADRAEGLDLSTYLAPDYALGAASRSYTQQSDNLKLYYRKDAAPGFGLLYTRFIINDKRVGSVYHASARSRLSGLLDEGDFRGLHHRNKAIGVYGLNPQIEDPSSIKLDVFFPGRAGLERVYADGRAVEVLPIEIPPDAWLLVQDGAVYVGVRALRHSNLGRAAPVRLEERDGDLVLSIVIYEGPPKRFWEYSSLSGHFYRGNIESGLVVEVASRSEFADPAAFCRYLAAARVDDATVDGVRTVRYRSGGDDLLLRYRLLDMGIVERAINGEPYLPPALETTLAVQGDGNSPLTLAGHRLDVPGRPSWLYVAPDGGMVTAATPLPATGPWRLDLAHGGTVVATGAGPARVTCHIGDAEPRVEIEQAGEPCAWELRGWHQQPRLTVNGEDRSGELREHGDGVRSLHQRPNFR
jgi:hypothetical protein